MKLKHKVIFASVVAFLLLWAVVIQSAPIGALLFFGVSIFFWVCRDSTLLDRFQIVRTLKEDNYICVSISLLSMCVPISVAILVEAYDWIKHDRFMSENGNEFIYTVPYLKSTMTERRTSTASRTGSRSHYVVTTGFFKYLVDGEQYSEFKELPSKEWYVYLFKINKHHPEYVDLIAVPTREIGKNFAFVMDNPMQAGEQIAYFGPDTDYYIEEFEQMMENNSAGYFSYIEDTDSLDVESLDVQHLHKVPRLGWQENPYEMITGTQYVKVSRKCDLHDGVLQDFLRNPVYTIPRFKRQQFKELELMVRRGGGYFTIKHTVNVGQFDFWIGGKRYDKEIELPQDYDKYLYVIKARSSLPYYCDIISIPIADIKNNTAFVVEESNQSYIYFAPKERLNIAKRIHSRGTYQVLTPQNRNRILKSCDRIIEVPSDGWSTNPYEALTGSKLRSIPKSGALILLSIAALVLIAVVELRWINRGLK